MSLSTSPLTRRTFVTAAATAATSLAGARVAAHNGEDHGSASPAASPEAGGNHMNTGTGAAYMRISNDGETSDRLIGAATAVARIVEVHEMAMVDGVMKMSRLKDGLEIPAKSEALLEPNGYHVMLINLTQDIAPDSTFDLELTFAEAGTTTITVTVTNAVPTDSEQFALGNLTIADVWSRPAPMITAGTGSEHDATPGATPGH